MKRKHIILSMAFGLCLMLGSCTDYLDSDFLFDERMSLDDVFKSRDYSDKWLAHAYSFLANGYLHDVSSKGYSPFCFADDMYFGDRSDRYKNWKTGSYKEDGLENISGNVWTNCYQGIRQTTIFINNIDKNEQFTPREIVDTQAQARFLRAYFYWIMLRLYGPVPLLPEEELDYTMSYEELERSRNTYDECVAYIANDLLLAARYLETKREQSSIARPTRGAALALRAKVLLYAASPLMNGYTPAEVAIDMKDDKGNPLLPTHYDESKWAQAAAAAKDVMGLLDGSGHTYYDLHTVSIRNAGGTTSYPNTIIPPHNDEFSDKDWPEGWNNIDPFESYRSMFNGSYVAFENRELIFTRGQNKGDQGIANMVIHQLPREAKGWNTHGMTQKQCDAYYMKDGGDCPGKDSEIGRGDGSARLSGYTTNAISHPPLAANVSLQYADREPRFYASVGYNGSVWNMMNRLSTDGPQNVQVFYYRGAGNGYTNTAYYLRTGIGIKKFVHPDDMGKGTNDEGTIHPKVEPAIRYAEVLLIYAEALNELNGSYSIPSWDGSETYTVSRSIDEMKKGIHPIRIRAGLPDYTQEEYNSQALFRAKLKRERQIELMGEGHRYYDLRRWMDAPIEESMPIFGCNALATSGMRDIFHTPVRIEALPTTFSRKMWFWPINHTELRRNRCLTQNPGWTYPE